MMKYTAEIVLLCLAVFTNTAVVPEATDFTTAQTMGPATGRTGTAATVHPASVPTGSAATMPPASAQTDTAPTIHSGSPLPVSLITTPATIRPIVTTLPIFPTEKTTPAPKKGFDGASFAGGIALGVGICLIFLIVYCLYTKNRTGGYKTM